MTVWEHYCRIGFRGFCALLFLRSGLCYAGAWNQPAGRGQVIVTTLYSGADRAYDASGNADIAVNYSKFETSVYFEHGVTERLTAIIRPSFQTINLSDSGGEQSYTGLGPTEIAVQWRLRETDHTQLSVRAGLIVSGEGENVPDATLGTGGTDYEARLQWGRGFQVNGANAFIDAQAAYRIRSGQSPNERRLDLTAGVDLRPDIQLLAQSFYVRGRGAQFPLRDYESVKLQASGVLRRANGRSYQAGIYQTLQGREIIREQGAFVGVWTAY